MTTSDDKREPPTEVSLCDACLNDYRELTFDPELKFEKNFYPFGDIMWKDEHPFIDGRFGPYRRHETLATTSTRCVQNAQFIVYLRSQLWLMGMLEDKFDPYWSSFLKLVPNWPGLQRLDLRRALLPLDDTETRRLPRQYWSTCGIKSVRCPKCDAETKSPWAEQCLQCGADWHAKCVG